MRMVFICAVCVHENAPHEMSHGIVTDRYGRNACGNVASAELFLRAVSFACGGARRAFAGGDCAVRACGGAAPYRFRAQSLGRHNPNAVFSIVVGVLLSKLSVYR